MCSAPPSGTATSAASAPTETGVSTYSVPTTATSPPTTSRRWGLTISPKENDRRRSPRPTGRDLHILERMMHPQPIEHTPMTGGEIAAARAAYGLTSADLAHILGVSERTARRWESGTTHPNGAVAAEIHAIDARIDHLADHLANQWDTARECGLPALELPETADDIPV